MLKISAVILAALIVAIPLFIFVHELGHFTAAKAFGYEPEMHFRSSFSPYVVYDSETREFNAKDGIIAISGVLATLLFSLVFVPFLFMDETYIRIIGTIFCTIGAAATLAPLLPFPGADLHKIIFYMVG